MLALLLALASWTPPEGLIGLAAQDCAALPADRRPHIRYLALGHLAGRDRQELVHALAAHTNGLSREADLMPMAALGDGALLRLDLRDFGWPAAVWEKLGQAEPYFHVTLSEETQEVEEIDETVEHGVYRDAQGRTFSEAGAGRTWVKTRDVPTGKKIKRVKATRSAPTRALFAPTPAAQAALRSLAEETQSAAPIVRGDWFLIHTAAQAGRGGSGYYDFLQLKKRDDIDKLTGLDRDKAAKLQKEQAAVVAASGVAINNRHIVRFQTLTGAYWQTLDSFTSTGKQNAARLLDRDFSHDAEEIFFTLPNGLFGFAASAADGELQESVPDRVAHDRHASGNDLRIHPGISCIRCHGSYLQPIDDWTRGFFTGDDIGARIELQTPDYEKGKRLRHLYLSDLPKQLKRDNDDFADALLRTNGLKPAENAQAFAAAWRRYLDAPVTGQQLAAELGVAPEAMVEAFKTASDPVLLGFARVPELRARREHIEEAFGAAMQLVYARSTREAARRR